MRFVLYSVAAFLLAASAVSPAHTQISDTDLTLRLDALDHQMRQLTGQLEQLQFRNQQLEQQLRRLQEDNEFRFQELGAKGGAPRAGQGAGQPQQQQQMQPGLPAQQQPLAPAPARRGDVYDPTLAPNAPGAPQTLGGAPAAARPGDIYAGEQNHAADAPLDISTLAGTTSRGIATPPDRLDAAAGQPGLPAQPGQPAPQAGQNLAAVAPPSQSPRDHFDLGVGYVQRKDYAAAETTFRDFLQRYPKDRLVPDAEYWLGESLFQRKMYREAAEAFLTVSTNAATSAKAPDSMLRLGQSLAALREKDAACATFAEIGRKYPRASLAVKQGVEREQKRAGC